MLELTLIDGKTIYLNPDQLLLIEETPDTIVRLSNGHKFIVKESAKILMDRFIHYKQGIHHAPSLHTATSAENS